MTTPEPAAPDAAAPAKLLETAVMAVVLLLIYGFDAFVASVLTILAIGGDGTGTNMLLVGGVFAVVIGACLVASIALVQRRMYVRSVLCGVVALPLAFALTLGLWSLLIWIRQSLT